MSLVAYGASDESDTSDVEDAEVSETTKDDDDKVGAFADDGQISDEDDYVPTVSSRTSADLESSTLDFKAFHTASALSELPAPKTATATFAQEENPGAEDELEDEVKAKPSQLADAPKPPPKKGKQPTRIVIPALKQNSDDEEEDDKKKTKQAAVTADSGSRSGLFALLPAPQYGGKRTNRPLIPYTLTKRPAPSKPAPPSSTVSKPSSSHPASQPDVPSKKHASAFNALTGYESDSDDEVAGGHGDGNFFSLGGEGDGTPTSSSVLAQGVEVKTRTSFDGGDGTDNTTSFSSSSSSSSSSALPSSSSSQHVPSSAITISESPVSSSTNVSRRLSEGFSPDEDGAPMEDTDSDGVRDNEVTSTVGVPLFNQDAPLNFNSSAQGRGWSAAPLTSSMVPEMYAAPSSSSGANNWQQQLHYAQGSHVDEEPAADSEPGSSSGGGIQQYMEDEQFLRISGKRKRGEGNIEIIEANVDDYVDGTDLMKGMTEESSYQPHRKKDNAPSGQQKRKKQITYLAFQAKERELELKNAWSQNRQTKNQSRSKYGF